MNSFFDLNSIWGMFVDFMQIGGFVMPPLLLVTFLLWYGISYRAAMIKINKNSPRVLVRRRLLNPESKSEGLMEEAVEIGLNVVKKHPKAIRKNLDVIFRDYYSALNRYKSLITVLLVVAPLLGLLGTVSGMIETFDSLQTMNFMSQDGGIAQGISQALITTQFGLSISVPGLILHSYINRRQLLIEQELEQLVDYLSSRPEELLAKGY
jgi:biopolymer transport protein ExbB